MPAPLHTRFVDKAEAAMTAAIEIYNKPSFAYREETFAILALNALELLMKGRIIQKRGGKAKSVWVMEQRKTASGAVSRKMYFKRNRAGTPMSISLVQCLTDLEGMKDLAAAVKSNVFALMSIRDNSVHFITASPLLIKQIQEIAAASVKNFVTLARDWFRRDMTGSMHLMLPLSFIAGSTDPESVIVSENEESLIKYLKSLAEREAEDKESPFFAAIRLEVKIEKSSLPSASKVVFTNSPDAVKVHVTDEDRLKPYPWTHGQLCARLRTRYPSLKVNKAFNSLLQHLKKNPKYVKANYLDPQNRKGGVKFFYNPIIMDEFDRVYSTPPPPPAQEDTSKIS